MKTSALDCFTVTFVCGGRVAGQGRGLIVAHICERTSILFCFNIHARVASDRNGGCVPFASIGFVRMSWPDDLDGSIDPVSDPLTV